MSQQIMGIRWSQIALGGNENVVQMDRALRSDVGMDHHILISSLPTTFNKRLIASCGRREGVIKT